MPSSWFSRIAGFPEEDYASTQRRLAVDDGHLVNLATGERRGFGSFEMPTLASLRHRAAPHLGAGLRTTVRCMSGDARRLHAQPELAGATFQVASQFNALEMVAPDVTPEDGVTRYAHDLTQGPACAIAAGAGTVWRNYLVTVAGRQGQTAERQIDTLAGTGQLLSALLARPVRALWTMRNGYALATPDGLRDIGKLIDDSPGTLKEQLRDSLAVAWQRHVEVTDLRAADAHRVSQVFCSALPVAYSSIAPPAWEPFARLVLEATYEATLLAAVIERAAGGSAMVLLTRVGGGAFGNADAWIDDALWRALSRVAVAGLDVRLVSHAGIHRSFARIAADLSTGEVA